MCFLGVVGLLFVIFAEPLVGFFTQEQEVIREGANCLRFVSYGYLFYAWGMVIVQAFNGAGDTKTPTWVNFWVYWVAQIPLALLLAVTGVERRLARSRPAPGRAVDPELNPGLAPYREVLKRFPDAYDGLLEVEVAQCAAETGRIRFGFTDALGRALVDWPVDAGDGTSYSAVNAALTNEIQAFSEAVRAHPVVREHLSPAEIEECVSYRAYLGQTKALINRVLADHRLARKRRRRESAASSLAARMRFLTSTSVMAAPRCRWW